MKTTIQIDNDLWEELNRRKGGEIKTFQEVIRRLLQNDKLDKKTIKKK